MALLGGLVHGVGIQNVAARSHSWANPRHLTVAEEGVWFSDRSGDPRIVALIARLDGSVDEAHVLAALSQVLSEVPLWASHPSRAWAGSRHHVWTEHSFSSRELLTIASGGDEIVHELVERMRLSVATMRPGLAVGIVKHRHCDTFVLVAHHALTDGMGALRLLSQLLATDAATPAARAVPSGTERSGLTQRSSGPTAAEKGKSPFRLLGPDRLVADPATSHESGFGFVETTVKLDGIPGAATVNDILIAATSLAMERWNAAHGRPTGKLTVSVPINHVPLPQRTAEVGNATGKTVILIRAHEREEAALLATVMEQTRCAKRQRVAQRGMAVRVVSGLQWLPAGLRRRTLQAIGHSVGRHLMPSVTVSNLGRVDSLFAGGPLISLSLLTTAGMPQGITVTAVGVDRVVTLALTYAKSKLSSTAARSFVNMITEAADELCFTGLLPGA